MLKRRALLLGTDTLIFGLLIAIPLMVSNSYVLGLLTLLSIYGILLIGLVVTVGYLGQINLAQAAFLGLGGYTAGLGVLHFGLQMPAALAAGTAVGLLFGVLLAIPSLRLEGPQFALATLSFSALTTTFLNELESITGGAQGLSITRPTLFGLTLNAQGFYWLCLAVLLLVWLAIRNLLSSRWGRAFEALRDSPIAADAMGVGTYRHKVAGFALCSALGGLAGVLYAFNFQYLQPQVFVYDLMVILLLGIVLGGRKSLWGAFVGASLIVLLPNLLSSRTLFQSFTAIGLLLACLAGWRGLSRKSTRPFQAIAPIIAMGMLAVGGFLVENTEEWRKAIFALMLFSVVVGLPEGIMGFIIQRMERLFRVAPPPLPAPLALDEVLRAREANGNPLLELHNVSRHFGGIRAVDGISLTVRTGQVHGLIGPNGSGKSTLVNVITGLYAPTAGSMLLRGRQLAIGSLFRVARQGIARTFQNLQIFGGLSALDNVMVAMKDRQRSWLPLVLLGLAGRDEIRAQAAALTMLEMVGLAEQARIPAKDLPYGAQRLLEIARALARSPELLILDEPAAGLAHPDVMLLVEIIRRIRTRGISIILIEHHMEVVSGVCDIVTVLDGGRVIAEGTVEEIRHNPRVIEAYLGSSRTTDTPAGAVLLHAAALTV